MVATDGSGSAAEIIGSKNPQDINAVGNGFPGKISAVPDQSRHAPRHRIGDVTAREGEGLHQDIFAVAGDVIDLNGDGGFLAQEDCSWNADNPEAKEIVRFRGGITSFSPKEIKQNSPGLRKLQSEFVASEALVDRIDKNAQFRKALDSAETRSAVIASFSKILEELTESLPDDSE